MMKTKLFCGLIVMSALALAAGCSDDDGDGVNDPPDNGVEVDFPTAEGSTWTYNRVTTLGIAGGDVVTRRIAGTRQFEGQTYACLVEEDEFTADTLYLRQDGDMIYVYPDLDFSGEEFPEELGQWFTQQYEASLPWLFANGDASVNAQWQILNATTTIMIKGIPFTVTMAFSGQRLASADVTVPAGTFDDTYVGRITSSISISGAVFSGGSQDVSTIYVADDVGIVKETGVHTENFGEEPVTETTTQELTDFSLGR
jgi:hypothetical protein